MYPRLMTLWWFDHSQNRTVSPAVIKPTRKNNRIKQDVTFLKTKCLASHGKKDRYVKR